jgi:hypothetical protein
MVESKGGCVDRSVMNCEEKQIKPERLIRIESVRNWKN